MRNYSLILCSLAVGLLSGCSESDYGSDSVTKDNSSGSMSIGVSLPSSTTRVLETADATKGLVTTWESTDALQILHKYTNNRTEGMMKAFTFASQGAGSSTTFKYTGTEEGNSFTPNKLLYAFNTLPTASNYTQTYNASNDNFTLSFSGYASQDGTVANLRNYDVMYGTSLVNVDGTSNAMGMKHLMSVIRFNLTNAAFTGTLTSVKFTYTSTYDNYLLVSSGSFILDNTGTVTGGGTVGATSWTVSNVAASSGTAPVYLMTLPDNQRCGSLIITVTTSNGDRYYCEITLDNFSLTSGSMKTYLVNSFTKLADPIVYSIKYYQWDATAEFVAGVDNYNTIASGIATNSCKDCPTYEQIKMYIGAGAYWDSATPWKDASGTTYTGGLWLKKKAYISGFDAGTATKKTSVTPTVGIPPTASEYFFLPASGLNYSGSPFNVGADGYYWSSTPDGYGYFAYIMTFDSNNLEVTDDDRTRGFCLWSVQ